MKIGVNARVFSVSEPGGAGQAAISLVRALADRSDTELTLFGHGSIDSEFDLPVKDTGFYYDSQVYGFIWEQTVLPYLVEKSCVDVFLCANMNGPIRSIDTPVVTFVHDVFRYIGDVSLFDKVQQHIRLPLILSNSDEIVTVSEFSKSEINKHLGVSRGEISIVQNGIDQMFLTDESATCIDLPKDYLLFVGGKNARKNIPGLLESFHILINEFGIGEELVIIGPSERSFHNYPLEDIDQENVHLPGFVTQAELKFAYENAKVFVFPSFYEGFGMAPLEAMACGTPVVASDRASMPEVLDDAAELVDPTHPQKIAEAVNRLLVDSEYRNTLSQKGKQRAQRFSWDRSAEKLMYILTRMCKVR